MSSDTFSTELPQLHFGIGGEMDEKFNCDHEEHFEDFKIQWQLITGNNMKIDDKFPWWHLPFLEYIDWTDKKACPLCGYSLPKCIWSREIILDASGNVQCPSCNRAIQEISLKESV